MSSNERPTIIDNAEIWGRVRIIGDNSEVTNSIFHSMPEPHRRRWMPKFVFRWLLGLVTAPAASLTGFSRNASGDTRLLVSQNIIRSGPSDDVAR